MFEQWPEYKVYLTPLLYIVAGLLFGIIFDRFVLRLLRRSSFKTDWVGDEIFLSGLRGVVVLRFLLAGVAAALTTIPISLRPCVSRTRLWS